MWIKVKYLCDLVTERKSSTCYNLKKDREEVMTVRRRFASVNEAQCVACGSCIKVCPREAIQVPYGISAIVDLQKCVGCGLCAKVCPASVIEIKVQQEELMKEQVEG